MTAGEQIIDLIKAGIRPRDIVTRKALENAAAVVSASGGSTNAALHLPAIAHECGIKFDLFDVAEIFKRTPYIADLKPGGRYVAKDMFEAGGVPLLMRTLLDHGYLHGDCLTVTGRTIAENLKRVKWNKDQDVVHPADKPLSATGGVVGLRGNLAPEGAIVKVAGMADLKFSGPARCFRRGGSVLRGRQEKEVQGRRRARDPLRRAQRWPRDARDAGDHRGPLRTGHGREGRAHHRRALLRRDPRLLHRTCRIRKPPSAARSRMLRDGDIITIDAEKGTLDVKLTKAELDARGKTWKPRKPDFTSGYLWKYAQQVGPARDGAVTHPGGAAEKTCYADI